MEINNQPPSPAAESGQPSSLAPQPAVPQVPIDNTSKDSNKAIFMFIIGLVVIVLVIGGGYFFLSSQQTTPKVQTSDQPPVTPPGSPAPAAQQNLESEVDSINVDAGGADGDFSQVDQDIQQL